MALDELGRGTSTTDGAAIASAVLHFLSSKTHCRSLTPSDVVNYEQQPPLCKELSHHEERIDFA